MNRESDQFIRALAVATGKDFFWIESMLNKIIDVRVAKEIRRLDLRIDALEDKNQCGGHTRGYPPLP